jgi:hypothetical protein
MQVAIASGRLKPCERAPKEKMLRQAAGVRFSHARTPSVRDTQLKALGKVAKMS